MAAHSLGEGLHRTLAAGAQSNELFVSHPAGGVLVEQPELGQGWAVNTLAFVGQLHSSAVLV